MASGANYRLFWREFRRTFQTTGAVMPSGPRLCRALSRFVEGNGQASRILEVGPGTGVVTEQIIARMGPADTLDVVELNDRFVASLRQRLAVEPSWQTAASRVRIHHLPVEQHAPGQRYHTIVSGLPLNNFPVESVRSILAHLEQLAERGGTLSFFEYIGVRKAKSLVGKREERERLDGIGEALDAACRRQEFARDRVLLNVPPAWVHHLRYD